MSSIVTEKMVRDFIWDRALDDNHLELDLAFSTEEIMEAMANTARAFNSIPPYTICADPRCLSAHSEVFLNGIASQLYRARLQKMMRNDIEYTAGGVTTSIEQKQIEHMKGLIKLFGDAFITQASDAKRGVNVSNAFAAF